MKRSVDVSTLCHWQFDFFDKENYTGTVCALDCACSIVLSALFVMNKI